MGQIKLFEEFGDEEYYQEISKEEANYRFNNCMSNMPSDEYDHLSGYFRDWVECELKYYSTFGYLRSYKNIIDNIQLFKLQDEYYLLVNSLNGWKTYYLCDQAEGLEVLLDKIVKPNNR